MEKFISTKSQVWYADLVMAVTLFVIAMLIYQNYVQSNYDPNRGIFDKISRDSLKASDTLLSPGYPEGWSELSIEELGIARNNRINETKLNLAANISYDETRSLLGVQSNYYVFFTTSQGEVININGAGMCGFGGNAIVAPIDAQRCTNVTADSKYISRINRLAIFRGNITNMVVLTWQ